MSNTNEFDYINETLRITTRPDPARGGKRVETRIFSRKTYVLQPDGLIEETTVECWKDIGTIKDEVNNHVPEQPTNRYKRHLIERARAAQA
jgi:hypothetical protein